MKRKVLKDGELLSILLEEFKDFSNKKIKNYLKSGAVMVNGIKRTKYNYKVSTGDIISIQKEAKTHKKSPLPILYEDKYFLVVEKPSGLLTIGTNKEKEKTAYHMMREFVKNRKKGEKLFILHRLDKDTSGVLVFVKNEKIKHLLQDDWDHYAKVREYRAIVHGRRESIKNYVCYLQEDSNYKVKVVDEKKGKKAITSIEALSYHEKYTHIKVALKTGRKNQIRVVLAHLNNPVVGDKKYGEKEKCPRLYLHHSKLTIENPITKEILTFESREPSTFRMLLKK